MSLGSRAPGAQGPWGPGSQGPWPQGPRVKKNRIDATYPSQKCLVGRRPTIFCFRKRCFPITSAPSRAEAPSSRRCLRSAAAADVRLRLLNNKIQASRKMPAHLVLCLCKPTSVGLNICCEAITSMARRNLLLPSADTEPSGVGSSGRLPSALVFHLLPTPPL